jgi:hypothetical protein
MPRPGRIRASTPPLICSTGISWQGCGARITSCSPVRKYPAPGTQARTLAIPSTTSSTWLMPGEIVPFGRYKGQPVEVMADTGRYGLLRMARRTAVVQR